MNHAQELRIPDPDSFYEALIEQQRGLSEEDALLFQAKLLLVLANQVGDQTVLAAAMATARQRLSAP